MTGTMPHSHIGKTSPINAAHRDGQRRVLGNQFRDRLLRDNSSRMPAMNRAENDERERLPDDGNEGFDEVDRRLFPRGPLPSRLVTRTNQGYVRDGIEVHRRVQALSGQGRGVQGE